MSNTRRIAVVGAGITGLTAAWALEKKGHEVVLFEQKERPGGTIRSVSDQGWLVEYGPNTLQIKERGTLNFLAELGLDRQIIEADPDSSNRYVVVDGELQKVPMSLKDFFSGSLLSKRARLRLLGEPFVSKGTDPQESLASFVERRLGREVLDYAVNPFVAGIYAGDPGFLSVKHSFPRLWTLEQEHGSLMAGAFREALRNRKQERFRSKLVSFAGGLQVLPGKLAESLRDARFGADVTRVQYGREGWEIISNGVKSTSFDSILLNIPLYRFNEQLINGGGALLDAMKTAVYPPLSVVVTGYKRSQVEHPLDGFGFLVPEVEQRHILGSLFSSSLFPGRAPEGHVLITSFVGGARQPGEASLETAELKKRVEKDLRELIGTTGDPVWFDHIYWPHSIPQYGVRYDEVLDAAASVEDQNPGVRLAGNFRGGISLPDCIGNGLKWAERLGG